MTAREHARNLLCHLLTYPATGADCGDRHNAAEQGIDALIAAAVEMVEARGTVRQALGDDRANEACTLRDLFAVHALEVTLGQLGPADPWADAAERAYQIADAMLAARSPSSRPPVAASPAPSPAPSKTE